LDKINVCNVAFQVKKAIIPAAGLGTRMWSLSHGTPKEMLPVGNRPMIHQTMEEAVDAGIEEICIVIRNGKEAIRHYFEKSVGADSQGVETNRALKALRDRCRIVFAYQAAPKGVGVECFWKAKQSTSEQSKGIVISKHIGQTCGATAIHLAE
jgi:UTP--glucose-1-phosphate uridylyltransferase